MMLTPSEKLKLKTSFYTHFPKIQTDIFGIFRNFGIATKTLNKVLFAKLLIRNPTILTSVAILHSVSPPANTRLLQVICIYFIFVSPNHHTVRLPLNTLLCAITCVNFVLRRTAATAKHRAAATWPICTNHFILEFMCHCCTIHAIF